MNSPSHNPSEAHPHFPSGEWESFYNDPRGGGKKGEMTMTLDFTGGRIAGSGSDPVGAYSCIPRLDTAPVSWELAFNTIHDRNHTVTIDFQDEEPHSILIDG
jgi:hypothetical protein